MRNRVLLLTPIVAFAIIIASLWFQQAPTNEHTTLPQDSGASSSPDNSAVRNKTTLEIDPVFVDAFIARFGQHIDHGHTRIKAIEKLVAYLQQRYPDTWTDVLEDYLYALFPDHAEALLALYDAMAEYNRWMHSEKNSLAQLDPESRQTLIWEMRYNFFGEQAEQIWAKSRQNERLQAQLERISNDADLSFDAKSSQYVEALESIYAEQTAQIKQHRVQELSDRFLVQPGVQTDLHAMSTEARYAALSAFRANIGMPTDAIERWHALDKTRDARWANGQSYLEAREQLGKSGEIAYDSPELVSLRTQFFGNEAEIIANEEAGGYFRFREARIYGRN